MPLKKMVRGRENIKKDGLREPLLCCGHSVFVPAAGCSWPSYILIIGIHSRRDGVKEVIGNGGYFVTFPICSLVNSLFM